MPLTGEYFMQNTVIKHTFVLTEFLLFPSPDAGR